MIVIATGQDRINRRLKEYLKFESKQIVDSMEFFFLLDKDTLSKFDIAIISRSLKGRVAIHELIFFLKQANIAIIYIAQEDETSEFEFLQLTNNEVVFEPLESYTIEGKIKDIRFAKAMFNDEDYQKEEEHEAEPEEKPIEPVKKKSKFKAKLKEAWSNIVSWIGWLIGATIVTVGAYFIANNFESLSVQAKSLYESALQFINNLF